MSLEPKSWRPASAADLRRIQELVAQAVDAWLKDWVVTPSTAIVQVSSIDKGAHAHPPVEAAHWSLGSSAQLFARQPAWDALLCEVLDLDPDAALLTDKTLDALLESVRTDLQDDLVERLCEALALKPALPMPIIHSDPQALHVAEIRLTCSLGDTHALFDMHFAAPWRWLPLNGTRRVPVTTASLIKRSESLESTRLKIMAMLGHCELSVAELSGLTVGDVIAMHQPLKDPLDVAMLNASGAPDRIFACGRPGLTQGRTSLQITSIKDISP